MKLGYTYTEVDERLTSRPAPTLLSVSQYFGVVPRSFISEDEPRADNFEKYKVCREGDLVLNRFNAYRGSLGRAKELGIVSPDYLVLRPAKEWDSFYLDYLLRSDPLANYMKQHMGGIGASDPDSSGFSRISAKALAQYEMQLVTTLEEQQKIAVFLNRETAKIDELIDKQEQLIATLREDRAATITQAVTKGLDSQVELRESGVRWMGAIPAHWCVDRIKNSVESARNGVWGAEPDGGSEDIRCVRVADFDRPQLAIHDRNITYRKVTSSERSGRILQRGDLLLEKSGGGDKNPVGFVVLYEKDEPAICSNFVARVQLAPNQDPKFWTYVHHCLYQSRLTYPSIKQNTGIQNLDQQSYFNERVGFPPFAEQSEIVKFLDSRCSRIDALIDKSTEMIETLREYRSALITNAVTGKIDVREAV